MKPKLLIVVFAAFLLSVNAAAQQRATGEMFHREVAGGYQVAIEVKIDMGWHLYGEDLGPEDAIGLPTTVELYARGIEFSPVVFPDPHRTPMEIGLEGKPTWSWTHNGTIVLYAFGAFESGFDESGNVTATLNGQTCSDTTGSCILLNEQLESLGAGADILFAGFPTSLVPKVPLDSLDSTGQPSFVGASFDEPQGFSRFGGLGALDGMGHASTRLFHRIRGNTIEAVVAIDLDEGWHLYGETVGAPDAIGLPTRVRVELEGAGNVTWDPPQFPAAERVEQEIGMEGKPTWAWLYKNDFNVLVRGTFKTVAPTGLTAFASGQTCSDDTGQCVDFDDTVASAGVGDEALYAGFAALGTKASTAKESSMEVATKQDLKSNKESLWRFVLLCIGGGLFTLLMPCTYPMIPITISFFTKQAAKNGKPPLELSLAYGIGIVLMFELIGFLVGPVIIEFAQYWLTNAVIGIVFFYFAFVLLGIVTLEPPRWLMQAAGGASQKGGLLGVFLMGVALVVTSFTCTAPILGTILGAGATSGNYLHLAIGMGAFGLTLALPFVVLSLVPGKLSELPSSGEWMNTLKVTLGFVELAAAFKFLSNWDMAKQAGMLPDEVLLLIWIVILGTAAAYLFGFIKLTSSASDRISAARSLFGIGFMVLTGYFTMLLFGYPRGEVMTAFLPGYSNGPVIRGSGPVEEEAGHVIIEDNYEAALERARVEKKLLLVNLTGFT